MLQGEFVLLVVIPVLFSDSDTHLLSYGISDLNNKSYKDGIYNVYTMRRVPFEPTTELTVKGILGFMKRRVTAFGNGAKVNCPKEYLGKIVYLVVFEE